MTKFDCPLCKMKCTAHPTGNGSKVTLSHPNGECRYVTEGQSLFKILLDAWRLSGSEESRNFFRIVNDKQQAALERVFEKGMYDGQDPESRAIPLDEVGRRLLAAAKESKARTGKIIL